MNTLPEGDATSPVYSLFADDPDYAEILEVFTGKISSRIQALRELFDGGRVEELERLAHQIKGAGGGYGFPGVSEAAHNLETSCQANDAEQVSARLEELTVYLSRIAVS